MIKKKGEKHSEVIVVLMTKQVKKVSRVENVFKRGMDVSKGWAIQNKVFLIFDSLSMAEEIGSFEQRCFRNRPMVGFTSKLMGISSYLCNVHFLLSIGQDKKVILVRKSRVDHLLVIP